MHTIKPLKPLLIEKGVLSTKRAILVYFFIVMTIVFVGCKSSIVNNYQPSGIESKANNISDYKVYEKECTAYNEKHSAFIVKYAQVSGLGNEILENQINQTLQSSITEWINKNCEWMGESQIAVKYRTSKYLSLCYTIELKDDRGEGYMSTYARIGVTVDMQTGERIYLDDLIKDISTLKQKLENYNYGNELSPPIASEEADKILHYTSISEKKYFEEIYKTDPLVYDFMFTYIQAKPSFYITDNKLVITRNEYDLNDVYIDFKQ